MARIVVTGATGMIGSAVCRRLLALGERPVGLTREPATAAAKLPEVEWHAWHDAQATAPPAAALAGAAGVIHL
ncbi:MAG: NAD-dependent epimerase/dehydratase family protein, partial [Solirubrobacteraceae bacterium]